MAYVFREYYVSVYVYLQNSAKMMVSDEHDDRYEKSLFFRRKLLNLFVFQWIFCCKNRCDAE